MFSDHLRKIDEAPHKTLFGVAAGLVILCQLVAMALVVDGQVAKEKARDAHHAHERMAVAQCMESSMGVARHSCIQQVTTVSGTTQVFYSQEDTQAVASALEIERAVMPAAPQVQSFMPASFATR
ncbi:hypothetical protein LP416_21275 [Polaromonas sp. P2-4]|nr:hypothetical protein LP416_21275 [Polaromonas sp. P2-4]